MRDLLCFVVVAVLVGVLVFASMDRLRKFWRTGR